MKTEDTHSCPSGKRGNNASYAVLEKAAPKKTSWAAKDGNWRRHRLVRHSPGDGG